MEFGQMNGSAPSPKNTMETDLTIHEFWMRRCLQLARCGELTTAPNPMVGAVVVLGEGTSARILGEGCHIRPGEGHAEVNALRSVHPDDRALLSKATIYVSLEPCAHYGRTPPCAELIVRSGIRKCVVGCVDPFSKVGGRGIDLLRKAGIEVIVDILREECIDLNRKFFCQHVLRRPFITLKWAASADGFIDHPRTVGPDGRSEETPARLSSERSLLQVHRLRATHEAILVGRRTFQLDAPQLNVRRWAGPSPQKCVLGSVDEQALRVGFQAYADIDALLDGLRHERIQSLLVEGGAATLQSFIERDLWDEVWEEYAPINLGGGVKAPVMPREFSPVQEQHFGRTYRHWLSPILQHHYVDF